MNQRPPSRRDSGYTLLEMMVALLVFGLVMAGLVQTFRFGLTAWSIGARNSAAPEAMAALDAALSRMIAQAVPGTFTGHADGLALTTKLPAGAGFNGGLANAAILLAPGGNLTLRYAPHPPGIPLGPPPSPRTELLASGVTGLSFTYLTPQLNAAPVWSDVWRGDGLPLLVRMHLTAGKQDWPDLVVAPVSTGE